MIFGLYLLATAGQRKDAEQKLQKKKANVYTDDSPLLGVNADYADPVKGKAESEKPSFTTGLLICTLSGIMSPMLSLAFNFSGKLSDAAEEHGASKMIASFAQWCVSTLAHTTRSGALRSLVVWIQPQNISRQRGVPFQFSHRLPPHLTHYPPAHAECACRPLAVNCGCLITLVLTFQKLFANGTWGKFTAGGAGTQLVCSFSSLTAFTFSFFLSLFLDRSLSFSSIRSCLIRLRICRDCFIFGRLASAVV